MNFGEAAYGEKYSQAMGATGYEYGTLANFTYVAKVVESSRRRESLSWTHHYEVASLKPDEQETWLARAEQEGWSRNQLRAAIKGKQEPTGQRAMVALKLMPVCKREADKRAAEGRRRGGEISRRGRKVSAAKKASAPMGAEATKEHRAADDAAELAGSSTRSVQRAQRINDHDSQLAEQVFRGEISLDAADTGEAIRSWYSENRTTGIPLHRLPRSNKRARTTADIPSTCAPSVRLTGSNARCRATSSRSCAVPCAVRQPSRQAGQVLRLPYVRAGSSQPPRPGRRVRAHLRPPSPPA